MKRWYRSEKALKKVFFSSLFLISTDATSAGLSSAIADQSFVISVDQQLSYVDNLFLLPSQVSSTNGPRHDWISVSTVSTSLKPTLGLQRYWFNAQYSYSHFTEHDEYNYSAPDLSALWDWKIGRRFSGEVKGSYRESEADFDGVGTTNRGKSKFKRASATGNYWFHSDWAVGVSGEWLKNTYTYETRSDTGYENDVLGANLTYRPQTGNEVVASALFTDGSRPEAPKEPGSIRDYDQRDLRLNGKWKLTGQSEVNGYIGYTDRSYKQNGQFDFSSMTGRLNYIWWVDRHIRLDFGVRREVGAEVDEVQQDANYSLTDKLSVAADWRILRRLGLNMKAGFEDRDYKGLNEASDINSPELDYSLKFVDFQIDYYWTHSLRLSSGYRYVNRDGDKEFRDYENNIVRFSVNYIF